MKNADRQVDVIDEERIRAPGRGHPQGVWTLPPTYRLKDQDRAKYQAIGESDRFTLKFVKR